MAAQTCLTSDDMDGATRTSLETAGKRYFDLAAKGDTGQLRQNSIPAVATDFAGIEGAIKESQPKIAGEQGTPRPPYLLQADTKDALPRAEFLCGVFGKGGQTAHSAVFVLSNLAPGAYAVVIVDAAGQTPYTVSFVLQKVNNEWKLGGFYAKPSQVAAHDGQWFWDQARLMKSKSRTRLAWLYYMEARDLMSPLPFMSTQATDRIYDESQQLQPTDLPANGTNAELAAGGRTYKLTGMFPVSVGNDLDLVVKYESSDVSDTAKTYQQNVALIKALLAKFPELREGFAGIIARATEPSGKDYGTLLAVKDAS